MVVLWKPKLHIVDKIKTKEWARTEKGEGEKWICREMAKMERANSGKCDLVDNVTCEKGD